MVIAAASVDDVLAISGFTILLGITFKPDQNIYSTIFQGPKEAIIGLLFGIGKYKKKIVISRNFFDKNKEFIIIR